MADRSNEEICRGRNGVGRLAIRILSVIANSAGCERAFSQFGITHTKRRNRLSPEVVHKTATVKAARQRAYAAAGLTSTARCKRKLGDDHPMLGSTSVEFLAPSTSGLPDPSLIPSDSTLSEPTSGLAAGAPLAPNDDNNEVDFRTLGNELVREAETNGDGEDEDEANERLSLLLDLPPSTSGAPRMQHVRKTCYPLRTLFSYPSSSVDPQPSVSPVQSPFEFFWHGGLKNVSDEMALYDLINGQESV